MPSRSRVLFVLLVVVLVITIGVVVAVTFTEPGIESIDNRWGKITEETSEIRTEVVIDNPNLIPIPPILTLHYDVRLNSVTVATGEKSWIGFPRGRSTIHLSTGMNNSKIAPWWRTHVEQNERTTMSVDPRVSIRIVPMAIDLPEERESIETEIIKALNEETPEPVSLVGDRQVVLEGFSASWGRPTPTQTPVVLTLTVDNRLTDVVSIENLSYRIELNDIIVGSDELDRKVDLSANEASNLQLTVYIENARMNDWWVTHLRNGEVTDITIELGGTARVKETGERHRFDLPVQNSTIETDILGQSTDP